MIDANIHREVQAVEDALRILRYQRETWAMLLERIVQATDTSAAPSPSTEPDPTDESGESSLSLQG